MGISSIICVIEIDFIVPFNLWSISIYFLIRGGMCHWQGLASGPKSHIGRSKVTLAGPKSHTRPKMSHWSVVINNKEHHGSAQLLRHAYFEEREIV